jgi:hypothetical protein
MASVPGVVALVLGTIYGLGLTAGPGLGKLLPGHPMQPMMKEGFDAVMGPFFGVPGDLGRILIGVADVLAGVGTLVALWGEQLGLLGPPGRGTLLDLAQSLIVCAYIGSAFIGFGGTGFHVAVGDPDWVPPFVVGFLAVLLLVCRLMVTPDVSPSVVGGFVGLCIVLTVTSLIMRALYGLPLQEAKEKQAEFKKKMEAQMAGPGASTEPLAGATA